jgi:hypothetical protein
MLPTILKVTSTYFSDFTIDCDSITDKIECKEEPSCDWVFNGDPIDPGHCEDAP